MDLQTLGTTILAYILNIHTLMSAFWVLVVFVFCISSILIIHWRDYGENLVSGFAMYCLYGFGLFVLLTSIFAQMHAVLATL